LFSLLSGRSLSGSAMTPLPPQPAPTRPGSLAGARRPAPKASPKPASKPSLAPSAPSSTPSSAASASEPERVRAPAVDLALARAIETDARPVSIGQVAQAAGISADTLRMWERRYGEPAPIRLPSGHRRYTQEHMRRMRRVAEAMALGHRPGRLLRASEAELDAILSVERKAPEPQPELRALLQLAQTMQSAELEAQLARQYERLGAQVFIERLLGPWLVAVGREWADGRLDVRHEHLLAETCEDFLRVRRLALPPTSSGPLVLMLTLPGEEHGLGLQMAALLMVLSGVRVQLLGCEVPLPDIRRAVEESGASAIAISVSLATGGVRTDRALAELRAALPRDVRIVVGGEGARGVRRGPRSLEYAQTPREIARWAARLKQGDAADQAESRRPVAS